MTREISLHEFEVARIALINAGELERQPVRVLEIKPRARAEADDAADELDVLTHAKEIMQRAIARGAVKLAPEKPVVVKVEAGKRLLPNQVNKANAKALMAARRARFMAQGLTSLGTVRKRSPNGTRKIYFRKKSSPPSTINQPLSTQQEAA